MTRTMRIGLLLAVSFLSACISGVRVRSAEGGSSSLASLPTFAVLGADPEAVATEELFISGQVTTTDIEDRLRESLKAALVARGFVPAQLDKAHFAVTVDANYYEKSQNMEMEGTRSFLGTGNRQKGATVAQRELSVALDFIDLRNKKIAWRITAQGPPPTPEDDVVFRKRIMEMLESIPAPTSP